MAESTRRQDQGNGGAETMRRATQGGAEIVGRTGKVVAEAGQKGDAAAETAARQVGSTEVGSAMRQGAEMAAAGSELTQRSGAEVARRAAAMEAGGRQFAQGTGEAVAQGAEAMRRALPLAGMTDLPQAFAGMVNDMFRANLQIGQEMMRLVNPAALLDLQQTMLRSYLDMVMGGARAIGPGRQDRGA